MLVYNSSRGVEGLLHTELSVLGLIEAAQKTYRFGSSQSGLVVRLVLLVWSMMRVLRYLLNINANRVSSYITMMAMLAIY
jgi:hypothetical protein